MIADTIIKNVYLTQFPDDGGYGALSAQSIALKNGEICWIGAEEDQPEAHEVIHGTGQWLTPGLIDCHTHLIYGGQRADEFERKLSGDSYEQIARAGGGIKSTVAATRAISEDALFEVSKNRLKRLLAEGVTTIEIKSGYGLDLETELKMLRVARRLDKSLPVTVQTTFLGAHTLPAEYDDPDVYIDYLINTVLPQVAEQGLADAVDFFCEGIGFSYAQCERICLAAQKHHLPIKGHVEQLSNLGGARLVAKHKGLSADHLEYLRAEDVLLLKQADVVPVLLPGAFYSLGETQLPPIQALLAQDLPIAIATDLNPGSSPIASILCVMNLACTQFKLSPRAVLKGVTEHAAKALGLSASHGRIKVGHRADLVLWPIESPAELSYGMNLVSPTMIFQEGRRVTPL